MLSAILLSTEEALENNKFWCRLDNDWVTVELEPFEEVAPQDYFAKPLSRDTYYARFPDIERSDSEDENSITLTGFTNKYEEWRSKVCIKRISSARKTSRKVKRSQSSPETSYQSRRLKSRHSLNLNETYVISRDEESDAERVLNFLKRITENIPPPPIELLDDDYISPLIESHTSDISFNNVEVPNYNDFVHNDFTDHRNSRDKYPKTSTLKKDFAVTKPLDMRNFNEFDCQESWYETIYGVSDIIVEDICENSSCSSDGDDMTTDDTVVDIETWRDNRKSPSNNIIQDSSTQYEYFESWSDLFSDYNSSGDKSQSHTEIEKQETLISSTNKVYKSFDVSLDEDDEKSYARFAVYKIYSTLKIDHGMADSSSMQDLLEDEMETGDCDNNNKHLERVEESYYDTVYRLAPDETNGFTVNL